MKIAETLVAGTFLGVLSLSIMGAQSWLNRPNTRKKWQTNLLTVAMIPAVLLVPVLALGLVGLVCWALGIKD
jgi:hypothetical protein